MTRALVLALWLAGCTGSNDGKPPPDTDSEQGCGTSPRLTIGTGETAWEGLSEGDPLTMVHGPQGGWHMLGSARVENTGDEVVLTYTITDVDSGVRVADNQYHVALVQDLECGGTYPGMYAFLSVTELANGDCDTPPEVLAGRRVLLEMSATDVDGVEASAAIEVVAAPDPDDDPACR